MRQFCDHGRALLPTHLVELFDAPYSMRQQRLVDDLAKGADRCAICKATTESSTGDRIPELKCGHCICAKCEQKIGEDKLSDSGKNCKLCFESKTPLTGKSRSPSAMLMDTYADSGYEPSSKVEALLHNLQSEDARNSKQ